MKIIVTGAKGQLGNEMQVLAKHNTQHQYLFAGVNDLDICDKYAVLQYMKLNKPDFIVNCAAYTAVTKAESDFELCHRVNAEAVGFLAEAATVINSKIIHISTDYVFDGKGFLPYTEDMKICPNSVYGKTKAEGEQLLLSNCKNALILRTSWLYSSFGNNFVKTMIKLGKEKSALSVIFDQIGTPTYAADLAFAIMTIINSNEFVCGTYHFSDEGVCSWYDFAKSIHRLAGITTCKVSPVETKDYPDKTPRPFYSVLNKSKIKNVYGIEIPYWEESLQKCISKLNE